ncbi:uncharacterized protein LOC132703547 [Cylas formicarius]|uniref:uncharacterized protein LOC132703547 n=1 Tax=Cylas formicarius TaxID=197179 RepID=UPI00295888AB|nr:uncharacterized protein LOC132703547 [Cylas formicarius]XP_060528855.1 uncharacterized protein LOC132703547 [Cylas formicarius]
MGKGSQTGGVKPMPIAGRFINERERLLGMTDADRAWRKQWLEDQHLASNEPRHVPQMYKATYNPIRRFYRWPLDQFENILTPVIGSNKAAHIRHFTGKALMGITFLYATAYYFKYNGNDWTKDGGWRMIKSRERVTEGDPGYPATSERTKPSDYASRGFKDFKLNI